ncbi:MAG: hypothetical protein Q9195_004583 [Heterodermia aff. obscurata]
MLPHGQDIRSMSFTKDQRDAQAAKRLAQRQDTSSPTFFKPTRPLFTLHAVQSSGTLPQQLDESRPDSSSAKDKQPDAKGKPSGSESENPEDWQDSEIPSELEWVDADAPDELRNIIQESIDEHRALRASRHSTTKAIVVRTTITQSRTNSADGSPTIGSQSFASASIRCATSSGELSSGGSMGIESTTSLVSGGSDASLSKPPTIYNQTAYTGSDDDLSAPPTGFKDTFRKRPFRDRGFFKYLASRKGKEKALGYADDDNSFTSECTSCFDDIPSKKAVLLSCRHRYCSGCFSQLVGTAIRTESTFPPKCCLQEIPRKTMLAHLSSKDMAKFDEKALEYAVPVSNRYYCASPECAKWIDVRRARGFDGSLECPHCKFTVCTMCRGAAHATNGDCPNDFGLDATLQQAERAGWQRCYNCRAVVELNTGCRHITCKCRAEFCYTCGARWKTCMCTESDQRRREDEIRERLDRFEAEAKAEEAEVRAAIAAVEAAERIVAEEREAEDERLAEESRQIAAREYERLEGITEFFEYLRQRLEKTRLQQEETIQKRHSEESAKVEEREAAQVSGKQVLDKKEQEVTSERARLAIQTQEPIKCARKKHASQLVSTVGRHRQDQDAYLLMSNEAMEVDINIDQTAILEQLLQAQDLERVTLRSQQTREIQKLQKRGELVLQDFDQRAKAAREERVLAQVREGEEVARMATATKKRIEADWKWFEAIFLDRAMMLGEDERRMILSGADAPRAP